MPWERGESGAMRRVPVVEAGVLRFFRVEGAVEAGCFLADFGDQLAGDEDLPSGRV
jgi:hypothetical protein